MDPLRPLVVFLALPLLLIGEAGGQAEEPKPAEASVKLTIDYGDGVQTVFTALKWREGMTVLDAMNDAKKHARGIKFQYRGKGQTAFLTQIADLKNEGRGRNWIFRVNGKLGEASFGVARLKAGDAILWKFGKYR